MSEPKAIARQVAEVVPGLWHWHVWDDRIQQETHAHAVSDASGRVLIDPLPLTPEALRSLEPITAICLTAACHQRSAWRYRRAYGAKVYAPEGTREMDEEPDVRYRDDEILPGGLKAVHCPAPSKPTMLCGGSGLPPFSSVLISSCVWREAGWNSFRRSTMRTPGEHGRACGGYSSSRLTSSAWTTARPSRPSRTRHSVG